MDERSNTRRYPLAVVIAVVVLFASVTGVVAIAQPDGGDVFTGCLNETSGSLRNVALGFEPLKSCNNQEVQITWDRAGPAFEGRIAELEARVTDLEDRLDALGLYVDCDLGDTVGDALNQAQDHVGPVYVTVSGVCEESVGIIRDDVTLIASAPGDGIQAPAESIAISMTNARRINLVDLAITGGFGILARHGSSFQASGVQIQTTSIGVEIEWNAQGELSDSAISSSSVDPDAPGVVVWGGDLSISGAEIFGNGVGVRSVHGGRVEIGSSSITDNGTGLNPQNGGSITIGGSELARNSTGIFALDGAVVRADQVTIIDSSGDGISLEGGSTLSFNAGVVSNSGASGVTVRSGSTAGIFSSTIENNGIDGVTVAGFSTFYGGADPDPLQILNNGGWGINCEGSPEIAEEQANLGVGILSGNTLGDSNCPAL